MRIVFMGTPVFAVETLKAIHNSSHEVVGVVTATDKPAGRGKKLKSSAIKIYAQENNINLLQPDNLKDISFVSELKKLKADLFIVVAFRMLPKIIWEIPSKGTMNLHASLLPQYRGAAPINWAIINGEKKSGITTFLIDDKIDTGQILLQEDLKINEGDNAGVLHDLMMNKGAQLVLNTINALNNNEISPKQQEIEGIELKNAPKLNKKNTRISWDDTAMKIRQLILGLSPYPGAWTHLIYNNKSFNFKIFNARIHDTILANGELQIINDQLLVGTCNGSLELIEVQMEGKKRMSVKDFINGNQYLQNCKLL